jgi:uncharacterized protein involved in exopolysaccharide biosynthesis
MIAKDASAENQGAGEESAEDGIDFEAWRDLLSFVVRAPRRHPVLATLIFALVAGLGVGIAVTMPRMYNSTVKLLVQRDVVGPAISNPGLTIPHDADNSTRTVAGTIMRRDNMIALVKETNLVERWHATRPAALRLKDAIFELIRGPMTPEEEQKVLAQTLEKRLQVYADESTVTISVDWQEPHMSYELAALLQKNFVGARYDSDVTARQDTITVLEEHAKSAGEEVDTALAAYQATVDRLNAAAAGIAPAASASAAASDSAQTDVHTSPVAVARAPAAQDPDLLKALEEQRRQIRIYEEMHQREIETLKQQLLQAQLTLTPQHPTVIALQQKVDSMSQPSAELAQLKSQERSLMSQIVPPGSAATAAGTLAAYPHYGTQDLLTAAVVHATTKELEDPGVAAARSRLAAVMDRYQGIMARLDSARLELDMTRTAFRYRYSVITPAEIARHPAKETAPLLGVASVLAALVLAFLCAALADWQTGRILETWQVKRYLKIEVLGEIGPPS